MPNTTQYGDYQDYQDYKDYTNWFQKSVNSSNSLNLPVSPNQSNSTDWLGIGQAILPSAGTALKGAWSGVSAFNTAAKTAKTTADAAKIAAASGKAATSAANLAKGSADLGAITKNAGSILGGAGQTAAKGSALAAGATGAFKAIGGTGGLIGLGTTALGFTKAGKESDYQDTTGNILKYGSIATGLLLGATNPIGLAVGGLALANNLAGKTSKDMNIGQESLANTGGGYGGVSSDISNAAAKAGKKTSWTANQWGNDNLKTKNINKQINTATNRGLMASNAGYQNKQNNIATTNNAQDNYSKNMSALMGSNPYGTRALVAKKGGTINPTNLRNLVNKAKKGIKIESIEQIEITKFSEGGSLNVIPEGALHARKHHLEWDIADAVTDKGIPVITMDEGGEITQHAEIEKNEIIFHKKTTNKLEEFFKQYNDTEDSKEKNAIAIECGKFLTTEILENTEDNTGLLETIQ